MIWMFPLYLLGAAAILGPILMHLRRRPPQERVEFSSLMFLEAQTPLPVSKRRLEHWLLLLLRCLALLLLAFMFARPLWRNQEETAAVEGEAVVVLVDRSASMRRGDLWAQAVSGLEHHLGRAGGEDRLAVGVFDRDVLPLWTFAEDRDAASSRKAAVFQRLKDVSPGWAATDLGAALVQAAGWMAGEPGMTGRKKRVVVLTDYQEGSQLEALRGQVWPETVAVEIRPLVLPQGERNLALSLAAAGPENPSEKDPDAGAWRSRKIRLRLSSAREAGDMDYTLAWEKGGGEPVRAALPGGGTRVIPPPPVTDAAEARVLKLEGDRWDFDNRVFVAPPQPKPVRIVFVGDEKTRQEAASPLFYLSRALQATETLKPELTVIPPGQALPADTDLVFVSGASPDEVQARALHAFMVAGGMVVQVVPEGMQQAALEVLSGLPSSSLRLSSGTKDADGQEYLMLGQVETGHPLLRPFADDRLRDFTKLRFWKHRTLEVADGAAGAQVIARFDNGSPAMVTVAPGEGTLVLLASGWHPADSQMALSTKFVPLLYGWLEAAGFRNEEAVSLLVGDVIPAEPGASIMTPEGQTLAVTAGSPAPIAGSVGHYTVKDKAGAAPRLLAVNLPPDETRVMPLDSERLRELGVRLETADAPGQATAAEKERLALAEQEGRQRAWLWLLGALLAVLVFETWLGGRIRERRPAAAYV